MNRAVISFVYFCTAAAVLGLSACGGGTSESKDTRIETSSVSIPIVPALQSFDKTFLAEVGGNRIQINLRRYGNELSGSYWEKWDKGREYDLTGSIDDNSISLTATPLSTQNITTDTVTKEAPKNGTTSFTLRGTLTDEKELVVEHEGKPLKFVSADSKTVIKLMIDPVKVDKKSGEGKRAVFINYPHLAGIPDYWVAKKVNQVIELYFQDGTRLKEIDNDKQSFKEDVTYDITYFNAEVISMTKNHHLSREQDTQLFDDSHGLSINYRRGKIYEIQDLIKPNGIGALNELLISKIRRACGGNLTEEELNACKVKPYESTSFSLGKDKITFHLTERLPYKLRGCGYIKIEYRDLRNIINPSGPLSSFARK